DRLCRGSVREELSARRQRGVTLMEAAAVLFILAAVTASIMIFYLDGDGSRKASAPVYEFGAIQPTAHPLNTG
ncbi:hypothetical protein, partial [Roseibium sp. RKSG952]|uniref:hypothetical protein n=1 Tax=Roseibium sp. RKSG952 TaxID=2529384 RepID=UPI0018AD13F9